MLCRIKTNDNRYRSDGHVGKHLRPNMQRDLFPKNKGKTYRY